MGYEMHMLYSNEIFANGGFPTHVLNYEICKLQQGAGFHILRHPIFRDQFYYISLFSNVTISLMTYICGAFGKAIMMT